MQRILQLIESKLAAINQADFQELCDRLLFSKYPDYSRFSRIGSQSGKQKTVKGTPDSLIRKPNGKYILIEYSTNITQGEGKLEDDVRKCLDPKRTAISVEDIEKIIICTNFRVKISDEWKLEGLLPKDNITWALYDLDSLSLGLCMNHRNLVAEFLGLPLDTGQVVSMQQFIQEYDRASDRIKKELVFNDKDRYCCFVRQNILFDLLISGLQQGDKLYSKVFFNLAGTFLAFRFLYCTAGINRHSVSLGVYVLPDHNTEICKFREKIWKQVDVCFSEDAFALLKRYVQMPDVVRGILEYDLPFIVHILEKHLDPDNFSHCRYVHKLIRHFHHFKIMDACLEHLSEKFTNALYEFFSKIRWDMKGDKEIFEYNNYDEYKKLKEDEIRRSFVFTQRSEIEDFCNQLVYLGEVETDLSRDRFYESLDIVVDENLNRNFDLGCQLLRILAEKDLSFQYIPNWAFRNHLTKEENVTQIWNLIQHYIPEEKRANWEMSFYLHLADGLITDEYLLAIRETVTNLKPGSMISLYWISGFVQKDITLLEDLLRIVWNRNEREGANIIVWHDILNLYIEQPDMDLQLAKRVYIQQKRLKDSFDYEKTILEAILKRDIHFLVDYINVLISLKGKDAEGIEHEEKLRVVWKYEGVKPVLDEIFDLFSKKTVFLGFSEHFCNSFFDALKEEEYRKAREFLLDYCRRNFTDCEKINIVVDITKNSMKELYSEVLLLFVSLTQNTDLFSKIYWDKRSLCYAGNVIIGSKRSTEWKRILEIINRSSVGFKLRPIKNFINSNINAYEEYAQREKKSRFMARE